MERICNLTVSAGAREEEEGEEETNQCLRIENPTAHTLRYHHPEIDVEPNPCYPHTGIGLVAAD
jgi:hypothetical protein